MNTKAFVLPSILDLKAASPLAEALLALRGNDIVLDGSQVERLGGQCLQVLISAATTWQSDGLSMEVSEPSQAFSEALALFGLPEQALFVNAHGAKELSAA